MTLWRHNLDGQAEEKHYNSISYSGDVMSVPTKVYSVIFLEATSKVQFVPIRQPTGSLL